MYFDIVLDVIVLPVPKSLNKLCGVWILFGSVEHSEIEHSSELIPILIPQTVSQSKMLN